KLTKDILDTASEIPFASHLPTMRPVENPYYVPDSTGDLSVAVEGHFLDAARYAYKPTLQVDGQNPGYTVNVNNTDRLEFHVPYAALKRKSGNPKAVEYRHMLLTVPYVGNEVWCIVAAFCKRTATFKFDLVALPESPGTLVITKKKHNVPGDPDTRPVTAPEQFQDSKDNDITEAKDGKLYCFPPRDAGSGWRIQPGRVKGRVTQVVEGDESKDWWWVSNPDPLTSIANACVRMETLHKGWPNHSGKVKFVVDYIEEHDTAHDVVTPVNVNKGWGQRDVVAID